MDITKILCMCFISILLIIALKNLNSTLTMYLSIFICILVMLQIIDQLSLLISQINIISGVMSIKSEFFNIIFKIVGISYATQFVSEICKNNGQTALSNLLELCGRITITIISLPIFLSLIELVTANME